MSVTITTQGLSKEYRVNARPASFRELLNRLLTGGRAGAEHQETFWALKDVSFEVQQGQVVGIIGRNGAGKSTLLKILSRIIEPTAGRAVIHGHLSSLLEVGTGFHPDLTGRENVYLNGAILGMKKAEIEKKFDAIVAFSEIGKFIDMPVKRYSSGMYVRLAFAVAAHLNAEVLLIDEVLTVGDAAFQNKCLSKIQSLMRQGTTCLFISHNMHLMQIISKQCLYIDQGRVRYFGDSADAVQLYMKALSTVIPDEQDAASGKQEGRAGCQIVSVQSGSADGSDEIESGDDLYVRIAYELTHSASEVYFNTSIWSESGLPVTTADNRFEGGISGLPRKGSVVCRFPAAMLVPGKYFVKAHVLSPVNWPLASFGLGDGRFNGFSVKLAAVPTVTGMNWHINQSDFGVVKLPYEWKLDRK